MGDRRRAAGAVDARVLDSARARLMTAMTALACRTGRRSTLALGVGLLTVAACRGGAPAELWTEVDSAGVRIVTSDPDAAAAEPALELLLSIGTVGGGGPHELHRVRDVEIVGTDRIAVANAGSEEIRMFDLEGRFLGSFGGEGRGPEELRGLAMVQDLGDSLYAYDSGNDRVSVRRLTGEFERSFRLEWFSGILFPVDISPSGSILAVTARHMTELTGSGTVVDTSLVSVYDLEGRLVDSVARLPHNERFVQQVGNMRTTVGAPFADEASLAALADGFCHVYGPLVQIRCFDLAGDPTEIWRVAVEPHAVTAADVDRYWDELWAEAVGPYRDAMLGVGDDLTFPTHFPAISAILVDDEARVWARLYTATEGEEVWWAFDDGRLVARLATPAGLEVMDMEAGLVAGVWRDALDVEHVRVYRRTEPGGG
ncbi:MAG TPA: hypothetical protein VM198_07010 [Longimicrobiales bacterium]|nr:hypothetical protein [Longimicrobiales bacterium]